MPRTTKTNSIKIYPISMRNNINISSKVKQDVSEYVILALHTSRDGRAGLRRRRGSWLVVGWPETNESPRPCRIVAAGSTQMREEEEAEEDSGGNGWSHSSASCKWAWPCILRHLFIYMRMRKVSMLNILAWMMICWFVLSRLRSLAPKIA
jgi:hypothetical protein